MKKQLLTFALVAACFSFSASAQTLTLPAPSPKQTVTQQFATSKIEISYSRPGIKGRKVFGDLVPYDKLWRTGANAATLLYFGEDVTLNGAAIPAGRYALLTIPGKDEWEIIINKDTTLAGTNNYKQESDLARFKVKPKKISTPIETFTIEVANITSTTADIQLKWEKTEITLNVATNYDSKVMTQIDKIMSADTKPYYQAATYYYDNGKDLNKALEWVNKAAEMNPGAFWIMHLKAKIQLKMGDKEGAVKSAEASKAKAIESKNDEYVKMNDALIAEAKK